METSEKDDDVMVIKEIGPVVVIFFLIIILVALSFSLFSNFIFDLVNCYVFAVARQFHFFLVTMFLFVMFGEWMQLREPSLTYH